MIEYNRFEQSLRHLLLQFKNYELPNENYPELIQEAVAESVIQRFETCYDCLWKVLKRYLVEELGLAESLTALNPFLERLMKIDCLPPISHTGCCMLTPG